MFANAFKYFQQTFAGGASLSHASHTTSINFAVHSFESAAVAAAAANYTLQHRTSIILFVSLACERTRAGREAAADGNGIFTCAGVL